MEREIMYKMHKKVGGGGGYYSKYTSLAFIYSCIFIKNIFFTKYIKTNIHSYYRLIT